MQTRKSLALLAVALAVVALGRTSLKAGGFLEQIDITGNTPSPIPGHVVGRLVPIRQDTRALPVRYSMNTSLSPIPNPLGAAFLTVADAQSVLQASLDAWNADPDLVRRDADRKYHRQDHQRRLRLRQRADVPNRRRLPRHRLVAIGEPDRRHRRSSTAT